MKMESLGELIEKYRIKRGHSIISASDLLNKSRSTIYNAEKDKVVLPPDALIDYVKLYNIPVDEVRDLIKNEKSARSDQILKELSLIEETQLLNAKIAKLQQQISDLSIESEIDKKAMQFFKEVPEKNKEKLLKIIKSTYEIFKDEDDY